MQDQPLPYCVATRPAKVRAYELLLQAEGFILGEQSAAEVGATAQREGSVAAITCCYCASFSSSRAAWRTAQGRRHHRLEHIVNRLAPTHLVDERAVRVARVAELVAARSL